MKSRKNFVILLSNCFDEIIYVDNPDSLRTKVICNSNGNRVAILKNR